MSGRVPLGGVGVKRPPAPGARLVSFHLVLAEAERDELREHAAAARVTMARYLVERALTGDAPEVRRETRRALRDIRVQLVGIAKNLNQATRYAHTVEHVGALVRLEGMVAEALARHDAAVRELR